MAHVHFDNTEDETHAALVHDCERDECPRRRQGHAAGRGRSGAGKRALRQDTKTFREERQQLNGLAPDVAEQEKEAHEPDTVEFVRRQTVAMETVGIEPTSADALRTASTSVAGDLCLAPRLPRRQGSAEPAS
jgi:hypothetical protein